MNRMATSLGQWMGLWLGVLSASASATAAISASHVDPSQAVFEQKMDSAEQADRIKELRAMFDAGVAPTRDEIEGWWSGRHYITVPNRFSLAVLFAAEKRKNCLDEGPLFPCDFSLRFGTVQATYHYPASTFDDLTGEETSEIIKVLKSMFPQLTDATVRDGSLVSTYPNGNLDFRVRKALNSKPGAPLYLVQSHLLRDMNGYGQKGELYSVGYFFKKVK